MVDANSSKPVRSRPERTGSGVWPSNANRTPALPASRLAAQSNCTAVTSSSVAPSSATRTSPPAPSALSSRVFSSAAQAMSISPSRRSTLELSPCSRAIPICTSLRFAAPNTEVQRRETKTPGSSPTPACFGEFAIVNATAIGRRLKLELPLRRERTTPQSSIHRPGFPGLQAASSAFMEQLNGGFVANCLGFLSEPVQKLRLPGLFSNGTAGYQRAGVPQKR